MKHEVETLSHCPVCGEQYLRGSAKTVMTNSKALLIHIQCHYCISATLAMVTKNDKGRNVVMIGMLTDLSYQESAEMMHKQPITADEVLDIYRSLK